LFLTDNYDACAANTCAIAVGGFKINSCKVGHKTVVLFKAFFTFVHFVTEPFFVDFLKGDFAGTVDGVGKPDVTLEK
jgi:hypothetical protein